jgi:hypothetical protein
MEKQTPEQINVLIKQANSEYTKAYTLKEEARKSIEKFHLFKDAANSLDAAAELCHKIIQNDACPEDGRIASQIYLQYYLYEKEHCLSRYYYERRDLDESIKHYELASQYLARTISIIESKLEQMPNPMREKFAKELNLYKHYQKTEKVEKIAIEARKAWDSGEVIKALDLYRTQAGESKQLLDSITPDIPPEYLRIARGNHLAAIANFTNALARLALEHKDGIHKDKMIILPADISDRLIAYSLEAYRIGNQAYQTNPEWEQYREGAEISKKNIKTFLLDNQNSWKMFLIRFGDDADFVKFMKEADLNKYKETVMELTPQENKTFRLWAVGSFFLLMFVIIVYAVYPLIQSNFSLGRLILACIVIETMVVLLGSFVLRATGDLSEVSFSKLIVFALKNQFSFLKGLGKKSKSDD